MGSSFKGIDLFGSGGHRFVVGRVGRRVVSLSALTGDLSVEGTSEFGDWELRVEVRGRLVAASDSSLWSRRDAITAQADSSIDSGTLVDEQGHSWSAMKLIRFEETGPTRRGREVSVGYVAEFGQLIGG